MQKNRVKLSTIVKNQLPQFVVNDYPLLGEFLSSYYESQEYVGSSVDILSNIDQYLKPENLKNITKSTVLNASLTSTSDTIRVASTAGFPDSYGLIKINDEILTYKSKTNNEFRECLRGLSAIESWNSNGSFVFSNTQAQNHNITEGIPVEVENLSVLFFDILFSKLKKQFLPGFDENISEETLVGIGSIRPLNVSTFLKYSKDFYKSKGTDRSFKILFKALYGDDIKIIKPSEFLVKPSNSFNKITKNLVVEALQGDPTKLVNRTLYQNEYKNYGINKSYGTVSGVEKIFLDNREYYTINLDFGYYRDIAVDGTVYGDFILHPKTKLIGNLPTTVLNNYVIDVDSTIGFPSSGTLVINNVRYTYRNKSINQFYNVNGGSQTVPVLDGNDVYLDVYAHSETADGVEDIKVRITPIISKLKIIEDTYYMSSEDTAKIKSIGYESIDKKNNNWFFNHAVKYEVKQVRSGNIFDLYDDHSLRIGDKIKIVDNYGISSDATVSSVDDRNTIVVSASINFDRSRYYKIYRQILKNSTNSLFSNLEKYSANVQNSYVKSYNNDLLVASNSIPFYYNFPLNPSKKRIEFWSFNGSTGNPDLGIGTSIIQITQNPNDPRADHGFYTGDSIYYTPYSSLDPNRRDSEDSDVSNQINYDLVSVVDNSGIPEGVYYVKRINQNSIKIANSLTDLYQERYLNVYAFIPENYKNIFEYYPYYNKNLQPQNILREINEPIDSSESVETLPGSTGIFINGVELLNYKSTDSVYYGGINNIIVTSPGFGYDIINSPDVFISDKNGPGFGATAVCSVKGGLDRIDIIDPGFNYIDEPFVQITGGNGSGASAKAEMKFVPHAVSFNAILGINTTNNTIGFSSYHKLTNSEKVIYRTQGQQGIVGLITNSSYYVSLVDYNTIKIHTSSSDAILGINTVSLNFGKGTHSFETVDNKKVISRIVVENPGQNYENKKRVFSSSGINTALDSFYIKDHGYNTKEVLVYSTNGSPISGLSTSLKYIVTKIDKDNFKLSAVGIGSTLKYEYFNRKQYVNVTGSGSGLHSFNYEPIEVSLVGNLSPSPVPGQNFGAVIQPIFRGSIDSINVVSAGFSYGSQEILNYNREPLVTFSRGTDAQVLPIVNDNKIVEVLVLNGGSGYTCPPNLIVEGDGNYHQLTPIVENGELVEVKVIDGGLGFNSANTRIAVSSPGEGCRVEIKIQKWTVNLLSKNFNLISDDDGVLKLSSNPEFQLQYSHLYTPRKLRESVFVTNSEGETIYGFADLIKNLNNNEINSNYHSPIIGWSYDGNPIYGPYGYENPDGSGNIIQMTSGYEQVNGGLNRPSSFDSGFFVEDYIFTNSGTLDEHNGRFCVTPEYPNGVYAYFTTLSTGPISNSGPFANYKQPVFPYVIGNVYKSLPNQFNFNRYSNQNDFDLNKTDWFRNITPYNLKNNYSGYDYIFNPNDVKTCDSEITFSSKGKINGVDITSGGFDYKVNDEIIFEEPSTFTYASTAKVTKISGKEVNSIGVTTFLIQNVEFSPFNDKKYVGYSTLPHNLKTNNYITISGLTTSFKKLQKTFKIEVPTNNLSLTVGVGSTGTTGIVTYFDVSGNLLFDNIRENDVLGIGTEKVKVLNVDQVSSRLRVLRSFDGTVGVAHSLYEELTELSRKLYFDLNSSGTAPRPKNKQYYFLPSESLGIGISYGVGIGTTLSFSNPGVGITQIFIPTKSIFLEKHNLNTGDSLVYSYDSGSPIQVSNGSITFNLSNNQTLYAVKITNNLIGLSTVASSLNIANSLFFVGIGSGQIHSLKTNYSDSLYGSLERHSATVSIASSSHDLRIDDEVILNVLPLTEKTVVVQYNDYNRRLIIDPKNFISSDVNTSNNTITLHNHNYVDGEKVIHISSSPCLGLENNKIYYVNVKDRNTISLSNSLYDSNLDTPIEVNIQSQSLGTIYQVNPEIKVSKNQRLKFDLSHPSLSFVYSSTVFSAFEFDIYKDYNFSNKFESSLTTDDFEVVRNGQIGISTNCYVSLQTNSNVPQTLYYKLSPSKNLFISDIKKQIAIDNELENHNRITVNQNIFSGSKNILGIGSTTFSYDLDGVPNEYSYNTTNSLLSYDTTSITEKGSIKDIKITNSNDKYDIVPRISSIVTSQGRDAIIDATSTSIGKVISSKVTNVGFDFPSDNTVRPFSIIPYTMKILPLSSFEKVTVVSPGKNYTVAPDLIVIDSFTNEIVDDVYLDYTLGKNDVRIFKNTSGFYNVEPIIIPINNSNGVGISTISFNQTSKVATVGLAQSFSTGYFPFAIGDKVLVENVSISGINTEGRGYNSEDYNYELFTISGINPQFGGFGATVSFNMKDFLSSTEHPGTYNPNIPLGRIINQNEFPIFKSTLKKNNFIIGEPIEVLESNVSGTVEKWNPNTEYLKVSSNNVIEDLDIVVGKTSKTKGFVRKVYHFTSEYQIGSSSIVNYGQQDDSGFLNSSTQKIHDNYYYQQFSYSLNSKQNLEQWSDIVDSLNHTSGFIKFSDLFVESIPDPNIRNNDCVIEPVQNTVDVVNDIVNVIDLESIPYFDVVTENSLLVNKKRFSNRIVFRTKDITDYFESIGNRVLNIDDVSSQFNREPRSSTFSSVDIFDLSYAAKKYFVYIKDKNYYDERQLSVVSVLHDNLNGFLNQYGRVETQQDLGYFDFRIYGSGGQLVFYPTKYTVNDYNISFISYDLKKSISSIGSTVSLGNIVKINSNSVFSSSPTTIVGISSNYRSAKILVHHNDQNDNRHFNEISIIHNGSTVDFIEYGQLTDVSRNSYGTPGLGTYKAYISGSNINLDFYPNSGLAVTTNTLTVSIAGSSFVTTGQQLLKDTSLLQSYHTNIPSSASSYDTVVASYSVGTSFDYIGAYDSAYYIVSVEDLTNNRHQISEVLVVNDWNGGNPNVNFVEYGNLYTDVPLGTISCRRNVNNIELVFTQIPNAEINVKVFKNNFKLDQIETTNPEKLDFINSRIISSNSSYEGTNSSVRYAFNLTHNRNKIFEREFVGNSTSIVDLQNNVIRIADHYFVTGEKLNYSVLNVGGSPIGIATTTVGAGTTNLLPSTVYAVKVDNNSIKLSSTAENSLKSFPITFDFTSVGIGSTHILKSTENKNSRVLVSIDNVIQSPIVSTAVTETLLRDISVSDNRLVISGISSIISSDLIKIDDEIMKVNSVGFGSTNVIFVQRPWMGTGLTTHSSGAKITKLKGSYNIIDNIINFSEPPRGLVPPASNDFKSIFNFNYSSASGIATVTTILENNFNINDQVVIAGCEIDAFNGYYQITSTDNIRTFQIALPSGIVGIATGDLYVYSPLSSSSPNERDWTGISSSSKFYGRVFMKSGKFNTNYSTYSNNYIFDDISPSFNSIDNSFVLKSDNQNISGISTSNAIVLINNIFQGPQSNLDTPQNYSLSESSGITTITFVGAATLISYDPNNASIPVGGVIVSIGSSSGLGYQPLVCAGGTSIVSSAGTIQSVSIGNSGSGYRSGIQTTVNVSIAYTDQSVGISTILKIGIASITNGRVSSVSITNPGSGYTSSNPPKVIFDDPLSYSNIPLIYSPSSSGLGTQASVDIIVGQGSSVVNFEIKNTGYGYKQGDVLTISSGGSFGIPLDTSFSYEEFRIFVDQVENDDFSGWSIGDLVVLDEIDDLFDGVRTQFPLSIDGDLISIKSRPGSNIDVQSTLLVFINDILQVPGEGYIFNGGSLITFTEPLKADQPGIENSGDKCKILFYKGNGGIDVQFRDVWEMVKVGDGLTILENELTCRNSTDQDERIIYDILSSDLVQTNNYNGPGINDSINCLRGVTWTKQREDKVINGVIVGKDREMYEPIINPISYIIQPVSASSTTVYVQNVKTVFDPVNEDLDPTLQRKITLISQEDVQTAICTAHISTSGIITGISILNGGKGYTFTPEISIESPSGISSYRATAIASVSSGIVTNIVITNPGYGYTYTPGILVQSPTINTEDADVVSYLGDFGQIVGIATTSFAGVSTGLNFDLFIPNDSFLISTSIVGSAITISNLQVGDFFTIYNTNVGNSVTSLYQSGSILGIGTQYLDNVYQVAGISSITKSVPGYGVTYVSRVSVSILNYNGFVGIASTSSLGEYSWGKVTLYNRFNPKEFNSYTTNGVTGITSSAILKRSARLKYIEYIP